MTRHIHKRFINEQVKMILARYVKKELSSEEVMCLLELKRSQFFELVKQYKGNPEEFTIEYSRKAKTRKISEEIEENILKELSIEKGLIDDMTIPVRFYNYSYVRDQMIKKYQQEVSVPTIIGRAKKMVFTSHDLREKLMIMKY